MLGQEDHLEDDELEPLMNTHGTLIDTSTKEI